MRLSRRDVLAHASILLACQSFITCLHAHEWSRRPIKWTVPYAAGGAADIFTRIVGSKFSDITGAVIVVENRPGAATLLATEQFTREQPDGYSILSAAGSALTIHPELRRKLKFDPDADLMPVRGLTKLPQILVVRKGLGVATVEELAKLIKQRAGNMTFSSPGVGSPHHLAGELFLKMIDGNASHVPFNGIGPTLNEMIAERIDFSFTDIATASGTLKEGLIVPLAVPDEQRHRLFPDIPTLKERGVPLSAFAWYSIMLPKGTSQDVLSTVHRTLTAVLSDDKVVSRIEELGAEVLNASTPDELQEFIRSERTKWGGIIRERGLSIE